MTTAFLFPGQGSQAPGMAEPFLDAWPEVAETVRALDARTEADLLDLLRTGDAGALRRTRNTQPAVFALGVAVAAALERRSDVAPAFVAGHSLGHYTAAAHAGLFDPADGIELVSARGRAMERADRREGPGAMAAVLLAAPDVVAAVCDDVDGASVAAYNTDRQTVVSGRPDALAAVRERIEERERERARWRELDVETAFHSTVMAPAVPRVAAALRATPMERATAPIVSDVGAGAYEWPATGRRELLRQVRAPIDWVDVVARLRERGVDRFVELPPAGALTEFASRLAPEATVVPIEEPADLDAPSTPPMEEP